MYFVCTVLLWPNHVAGISKVGTQLAGGYNSKNGSFLSARIREFHSGGLGVVADGRSAQRIYMILYDFSYVQDVAGISYFASINFLHT